MRKEYETNLEEMALCEFRIMELSGMFQKNRLTMVGAFTALIFVVIFGLSRSWLAAFAGGLIFAIASWFDYKKTCLKRLQKYLKLGLGKNPNYTITYSLDQDSITYSFQEIEMKLFWKGLKELTETEDFIELLFEPTAIIRLPKRIFENDEEKAGWLNFIKKQIN